MSRIEPPGRFQCGYSLGASKGRDACLVGGSATLGSAAEGGGRSGHDPDCGAEGFGGRFGRFGEGKGGGLGGEQGRGATAGMFLWFSFIFLARNRMVRFLI